MDLNKLDSNLIELLREQQMIEGECEEIDNEIEEREMRRDCLESRAEGIESEISSIKKHMLEASFSIEDRFLQDFIKASWFCSKLDSCPSIQYVKITDDNLIALDGYKAIAIKTDVPQELKNTFIKWDVRENFKEYIESIENYPDVKKVFEDAENKIVDTYFNLTSEEFYKKFNAEKFKKPFYGDIWLIKCGDIETCFNKEYMNPALMALKGTEFTLKINGETKPILLENERTKIIVLPIRRNN